MANGKLVTLGKTDILTWYFKNIQISRPSDSLYLGLYTNTTEPPITATLSSGLTELALGGYARIQLVDSDWTVTDNQVDNVQKIFTAAVDWGNVYGSFTTNLSTGVGTLISVKHFTNGPFNILTGKTIEITPKILITP
jgi:hypothetical protein